MATQLKSHATDVTLTRFWGGEKRGSSIQVTLPASDDSMEEGVFFDHIQLTRAQAAALSADLLDFAQGREVEDINFE